MQNRLGPARTRENGKGFRHGFSKKEFHWSDKGVVNVCKSSDFQTEMTVTPVHFGSADLETNPPNKNPKAPKAKHLHYLKLDYLANTGQVRIRIKWGQLYPGVGLGNTRK